MSNESESKTKLLVHYRKLHDGLSDMVEGGRLQKSDIPDDYQWLVEMLIQAVALDDRFKPTKAQYYATARNYGWSPDDEDSPQEFLQVEQIGSAEILATDITNWADEYKAYSHKRSRINPRK